MMKKLVWIAVAGVVLFLAVAWLLPSSYMVERTIEIARPPEVVFEQVADFHNWLQWNAWTEMEPTAKNTITGPVAAPGAKWAWEGEELGSGSMEVVAIEPNRSIRYDLLFKTPMEGRAVDSWAFVPSPSGTRVTWKDGGELAYPMGRYFGLMLDGMVGEQFDRGLSNLKARCEGFPASPSPTSALESPTSGG